MSSEGKTKPRKKVPQRKPKGLGPVEHDLMVRMSLAGKSQKEIGAAMGVDQTRVSQVLAAFSIDTRESARKRMYSAADEIAQNVIAASARDPWVGLEVLDRTDTLAKKDRSQAGKGGNVLVIVGSQDARALPPGIVDAEVTEASPVVYPGEGAPPPSD